MLLLNLQLPTNLLVCNQHPQSGFADKSHGMSGGGRAVQHAQDVVAYFDRMAFVVLRTPVCLDPVILLVLSQLIRPLILAQVVLLPSLRVGDQRVHHSLVEEGAQNIQTMRAAGSLPRRAGLRVFRHHVLLQLGVDQQQPDLWKLSQNPAL